MPETAKREGVMLREGKADVAMVLSADEYARFRK
jgi:hypothetical protein